ERVHVEDTQKLLMNSSLEIDAPAADSGFSAHIFDGCALSDRNRNTVARKASDGEADGNAVRRRQESRYPHRQLITPAQARDETAVKDWRLIGIEHDSRCSNGAVQGLCCCAWLSGRNCRAHGPQPRSVERHIRSAICRVACGNQRAVVFYKYAGAMT